MFNFNALVSRIKYIPRWSLMRQSRPEYVAEHSAEVMQLAHTLALIGNTKFGKSYNVENIVLSALYHDISEILTGDMPTPVKYKDEALKTAYKVMEEHANLQLIETLDPDICPFIAPHITLESLTSEEVAILKGADKLSALIKCIEESRSGNDEFESAFCSIENSLIQMNLKETNYFMEYMLQPYHLCLDELAKI